MHGIHFRLRAKEGRKWRNGKEEQKDEKDTERRHARGKKQARWSGKM